MEAVKVIVADDQLILAEGYTNREIADDQKVGVL